jgi:hypothetical protein
MRTLKSLDQLVYLDKEYISEKYEEVTGYTPETLITKTEGLNAGVKIPILSAGASSVESKSYKLSTRAMLPSITESLTKLNEFSSAEHSPGKTSNVVWVSGRLFVSKVEVTRSATDERTEHYYFKVSTKDESTFALITSDDYFSSGIDAFRELQGNIIEFIDMPVRALLRVYPAHSAFGEWIATPFIIFEDD